MRLDQGCNRCITCCGHSYYYRAGPWMDVWPSNIPSPTIYFLIRAHQLASLAATPSHHSWRSAASTHVDPSTLRAVRHLPQLSVLVPQAYTNVGSKETVEYVGTVHRALKRQQRQQQPAATAMPLPFPPVAATTQLSEAWAHVPPAPPALQAVTPPQLPGQRAARRQPAAQCTPSRPAPCTMVDSWSSGGSRPSSAATASSDSSASSVSSGSCWQQQQQAQQGQQHTGSSLRGKCRLDFSPVEQQGEQQGGWQGHKPPSPEVRDRCWGGWQDEPADIELMGSSEQLLWGMAAPGAAEERASPGSAVTLAVKELLVAAMEQLRQLRRLVVGGRSVAEVAYKREAPRLTCASPISVISRRALRRAPTYQRLDCWA